MLEGIAEPDTETVTTSLDHHPLTFGLLIDRLLGEPSTALSGCGAVSEIRSRTASRRVVTIHADLRVSESPKRVVPCSIASTSRSIEPLHRCRSSGDSSST